jgi:hypothetical protein
MSHIFVYVKSVYGNDLTYPSCYHAKCFARMAGTTTLTDRTISEIKNLGIEIMKV